MVLVDGIALLMIVVEEVMVNEISAKEYYTILFE